MGIGLHPQEAYSMPKHTDDRQDLYITFSTLIAKRFAFLKRLGFEFFEISQGHVVFSSKNVSVSFYYERISFEVYLVITQKDKNISCSIDEIVQFVDTKATKRRYQYAPSGRVLDFAIAELLWFLKEYGEVFIDGDAVSFEKIKERTEEQNKALMLEKALKEAEKKAVFSWKHNDYEAVIEVYNTILEHLTPVQRKRMDICVKLKGGILGTEIRYGE